MTKRIPAQTICCDSTYRRGDRDCLPSRQLIEDRHHLHRCRQITRGVQEPLAERISFYGQHGDSSHGRTDRHKRRQTNPFTVTAALTRPLGAVCQRTTEVIDYLLRKPNSRIR